MLDTIKNLVLEVTHQLKNRGWTLVTAESCTGGGLSYWLTSVPGSSAWFECGFVTYSNNAKGAMLGVSEEIINLFGAVSEETARAMAEGALARSRADLSISITGIAGPAGGTIAKPIGTVWFAVAGKQFPTLTKRHIFPGDRQTVRLAAIAKALEQLLDCIR